MRNRTGLIIALIAGLGVLLLLGAAYNSVRRDNRTPIQQQSLRGPTIYDNRLPGTNPQVKQGPTVMPPVGVNPPARTNIGANPSPYARPNPANFGTMPQRMAVQSPMPINIPDLSRARNIKNQLVNMPQIKKANVVVNGNNALAAYMSSNRSENADSLKRMVVDRVKQVDKNIKNVYSNESPKFMKTLEKISKDIQKGTASTRIGSEINKAIKGMQPAA